MDLTFLPRIWLMAALSFRVHSATTLALISFIYNMKALCPLGRKELDLTEQLNNSNCWASLDEVSFALQ